MVFLLLEPLALHETLEAAKQISATVWLGADAITEAGHQEHHRNGYKITRFSYELAHATLDIIEDALLTIKEHHPSEVIWVMARTAE